MDYKIICKIMINIRKLNMNSDHVVCGYCGVAYLPKALECHGTHTLYNYTCPICGRNDYNKDIFSGVDPETNEPVSQPLCSN